MTRSNPSTTHGNAGIAAWNFKLLGDIGSFDDCVAFMAEHGDDGFAKLGPHMTLIHEGHDLDPAQGERTYAVELYSTKIIRYYPDGTFSVDNGGHATPTTRERLQAIVPSGFLVSHHRKQLGLWRTLGPHGGERGPLHRVGLWPLDHSKRITTTGDLA